MTRLMEGAKPRDPAPKRARIVTRGLVAGRINVRWMTRLASGLVLPMTTAVQIATAPPTFNFPA